MFSGWGLDVADLHPETAHSIEYRDQGLGFRV